MPPIFLQSTGTAYYYTHPLLGTWDDVGSAETPAARLAPGPSCRGDRKKKEIRGGRGNRADEGELPWSSKADPFGCSCRCSGTQPGERASP